MVVGIVPYLDTKVIKATYSSIGSSILSSFSFFGRYNNSNESLPNKVFPNMLSKNKLSCFVVAPFPYGFTYLPNENYPPCLSFLRAFNFFNVLV